MGVRIQALIGAHGVVLLLAAMAASDHCGPFPAPIFLLAFISADAALLGMWASLAAARWQIRLCLAGALLLFWATFVFGQRHLAPGEYVFFALVIALPWAVVFIVLRILQAGPRQLAIQCAPDVSGREGFQFSLSRLLAATTLIAVALSVGRLTEGMGNAGTWMRLLAAVLVIPPSFVLVALATIWAALGLGHPLPRLLVVIPMAFLVGFVSLFGIRSDLEWEPFLGWSGLTGMMAIVIAGNLLVVRSAGWRLCSAANETRRMPEPSVQGASPF